MADEQKSIRLMQAEVNYVPLSGTPDKACASCRWFNANGEYGAYCHLIDNWPVDVMATGLCDRHELLPQLEIPTPTSEVAIEAAVEAVGYALDLVQGAASVGDEKAHEHEMKVTVTDSSGASKSIARRIKEVFIKPDSSPFQVFKGSDDKHYWLARHTNMFEDRDKEILSSKAHTAYISRINLGLVDKPELWSYHTKGTKHGQADLVWEHAGFVFALGHFDDTPEAQQAIKAYQKRKGKIELSHGFTYPRWALKDGVYTSYNTFEISTLPEGAASNPYTTFEEVNKMALSEKQEKWIEETMGKEAVNRAREAQKSADSDSEVLKATDKKYKDFAELESPTPEQVKLLDLEKTVGSVLGSLIAAQAEAVETLDTVKSDLATLKTEKTEAQKSADEKATTDTATIKALQEQVKQLELQLNARPRQASKDGSTAINVDDIPADLKTNMSEKNSFWGTDVSAT